MSKRLNELLEFIRRTGSPDAEGLTTTETVDLCHIHDRFTMGTATEGDECRRLELMERGWGKQCNEPNPDAEVVVIDTIDSAVIGNWDGTDDYEALAQRVARELVREMKSGTAVNWAFRELVR